MNLDATGLPPAPGAENDAVLRGSEVGGQVTLRIANQTMRFQVARPGMRFFLHDNHVAFRVRDDVSPDCEVRWTIENLTVSPDPVFRRFEQRWEIRRFADGREEITFYNVGDDGSRMQPGMQILSNPDFSTLEVRQAPRASNPGVAYVSEYPWAEYITQRRLGLHGGVMLHSSMAVFEGVAHLFMGHSGAGKSTIAELAEQLGATIPTDDRTILTVGKGGATAWGTPWHGSFRRTSSEGAPIGSISLLVQDAVDKLEPLELGRAVKEMYVRTVQARITEPEVQGTLATLEMLAELVPCYELRFRPTTAAVTLVLESTRRGFSPLRSVIT